MGGELGLCGEPRLGNWAVGEGAVGGVGCVWSVEVGLLRLELRGLLLDLLGCGGLELLLHSLKLLLLRSLRLESLLGRLRVELKSPLLGTADVALVALIELLELLTVIRWSLLALLLRRDHVYLRLRLRWLRTMMGL